MLILTFLYLLGLPFAREVFLCVVFGDFPRNPFYFLKSTSQTPHLLIKSLVLTLPNPPYREGPKGPGPLDTRKLGGSLQLARKEAGIDGGPALLGLPTVIPQTLPCEGFRHCQVAYGSCAGWSRATDLRRPALPAGIALL